MIYNICSPSAYHSEGISSGPLNPGKTGIGSRQLVVAGTNGKNRYKLMADTEFVVNASNPEL